ncbi:MAG: FtsB family cell division protein [Vicinamibacterales bacterium]
MRGWRLLRQALLLATAVFLIDAIAGEKGFFSLLQARRDYQVLQESLERARAANAALREHARRLREEPGAIEEEARRELGLIKPGETLFIIKEIQPTPKK